jgi:hypothetical protein
MLVSCYRHNRLTVQLKGNRGNFLSGLLRHIDEAFGFLLDDLGELTNSAGCEDEFRRALESVCGGRDLFQQVKELQSRVMTDNVSEQELLRLMNLMMVSIAYDREISDRKQRERIEWQSPVENCYEQFALNAAPVY